MLQCRLVHIQADYLYGRLPKFTHGWRGSTSICTLTLGSAILMVDLLFWLTKERPSSVTTMGIDFAKANSPEEDGNGFAGDSLRISLLSFPSELAAFVSANFASLEPHLHHLGVYVTKDTFVNFLAARERGGRLVDNVAPLLRGNDPVSISKINSSHVPIPKATEVTDFNRAMWRKEGFLSLKSNLWTPSLFPWLSTNKLPRPRPFTLSTRN